MKQSKNNDISDKLKKAFDFAQDTTKQLISLATGIIAITITFTKDILGNLPPGTKVYLGLSWLIFFLSIIFGVWALLAMTGSLEPKKGEKESISIRGSNVTLPSALQIISFLLGLALAIVYGMESL